jgi:glutathione S-transferase
VTGTPVPIFESGAILTYLTEKTGKSFPGNLRGRKTVMEWLFWLGSDDRILGFTMIGSEAGEVMIAVQTAMLAGPSYQRLRDAVIAHLTVAEGLGPLFSNVPPLSAR